MSRLALSDAPPTLIFVPGHAYIDESDRGDYLVCAAVVASRDVENVRKALRGLRRRGANRLHMSKESAVHKRSILSAICRQPIEATIFVSHYPVHRQGRAEIMRRVVNELGVDRAVIESAVGQDGHDRTVLFEAVRKAGLEHRFSYTHMAPRAEPLLWLPDAIAWAWGAGNEWRRRASAVVAQVIVVEP